MPRKTITIGSPHYEYDFSNDYGPMENGMGYALGQWLSLPDKLAAVDHQKAQDARDDALAQAQIGALTARAERPAATKLPQTGQVAPHELIDDLTTSLEGVPKTNPLTYAPEVDEHGNPVMEYHRAPRKDAEDRLYDAGIDPKSLRFFDLAAPPARAPRSAALPPPALPAPRRVGPVPGPAAAPGDGGHWFSLRRSGSPDRTTLGDVTSLRWLGGGDPEAHQAPAGAPAPAWPGPSEMPGAAPSFASQSIPRDEMDFASDQGGPDAIQPEAVAADPAPAHQRAAALAQAGINPADPAILAALTSDDPAAVEAALQRMPAPLRLRAIQALAAVHGVR